MTRYRFATAVIAPSSVYLRWDTASGINSPKSGLYNADGLAIPQSSDWPSRWPNQTPASRPDGTIRSVYADDAGPLYLKQIDTGGKTVTLLATVTGVDPTIPSGSPGGGTVSRQGIIDTGLAPGDIDAAPSATVAGGVLPTRVASLTPATTSAAPTVQRLNLYDATSGNLTPALPAASSVAAGVVVGFKKTDATANVVSPTCAGSDHIGSATGSTSIPIRLLDQITYLASDGVSVWTKIAGDPLPGLDARYDAAGAAAAAVAASDPAGAASSVQALLANYVLLSQLSTATQLRATTGAPTALSTDQAGDFAFDRAGPTMYGPFTGNGITGTWPAGVTFANPRSPAAWAQSAALTPSPSSGTLGAATGLTPDSGYTGIQGISAIQAAFGGTFGSETATVSVTATFADATTSTQTITSTTATNVQASINALFSLAKGGSRVAALSVAMKSNIASSAVTATVKVLGSQS